VPLAGNALKLVRINAAETSQEAFSATPATVGLNFADAEVPPEVINGAGAAGNHVFTLLHAPSPAASLQLFHKDGPMYWPVTDYTLAGLTITFVAGNPPQAGDLLKAWYRW
jgi:hypothetical protein